jgi:hypothetical protein
LPAYQGPARVTLLVIDPYLVHAYWDVDPAMETSPGVLRVYDTTGETSSYFDLPVSLGARNWYIQLWTPERSYYAELGRNEEGRGFSVLARSNTIQTPRAWPAVEMEHWDAPATSEPAPAATPVETPELVLQESPPLLPLVTAPQPDHSQWGSAMRCPAPEPDPPPIPEPIDAPKLLRERLEQIYSTLDWMAPPAEPSKPPETPAPSERPADLTKLAEEHFSTGISSKIPKPPA